MTAKLITTIQKWQGYSTDTKPASPTYVGSEFEELDTGRIYVWNGSGWVVKPVHILNVQGGGYTIEDIMEMLRAELDLQRSPQSGTFTFPDNTEQTLFEESSTYPMEYYGSLLDFTGCNSGAGEDTTVKLYVKVKSGGTYRLLWESGAFLAAAVPDPPARLVPNDGDAHNSETVPVPVRNVYGVKLTATQAGGTLNTIDHEHFISKRGG